MQHTITSAQSLGMVRAQLLEFFEKQSYDLKSLDPNKLRFSRRGNPPAAALVLLSMPGDDGTQIELDWRLLEQQEADNQDDQSLQRELQGLLAAIQGEVKESVKSSAALNPPKVVDARTFNTILRADMVFRSSARWFFWIAGLSVINSIIFRMDGAVNFLFGLGLTQVVDVMDLIIVDNGLFPNANAVHAFSLVLVLLISGMYAAFGLLIRNRKKWALYLGTVLYLIDGLILLFIMQDYISAAFHGYILFLLFRGWVALRELRSLKGSSDLEPPNTKHNG